LVAAASYSVAIRVAFKVALVLPDELPAVSNSSIVTGI